MKKPGIFISCPLIRPPMYKDRLKAQDFSNFPFLNQFPGLLMRPGQPLIISNHQNPVVFFSRLCHLFTLPHCHCHGFFAQHMLGILFGAMSYTIIDKIIVALKMDSLINDAIKGVILLAVIMIQLEGPKIKGRLKRRTNEV